MKHALTGIQVIPPDGITWQCTCGSSGTCPRQIGLMVLITHLNLHDDEAHAIHNAPGHTPLCKDHKDCT